MKIALAALAAVSSLAVLVPDQAEAHRTGYRHRHVQRAVTPVSFYRRPASVASNGLCQRDTGTPTSSLNFRNRCDTEEFWNRIMQGGRRR